MKTIKQIKIIEVTINKALKQIEELKNKHIEKAKWSPKGGEWSVDAQGSIINYLKSNLKCREFGTEYQTKEQAEKARDAMRNHNRLLAWLAENDDGWKADWSDIQRKYFVYLVRDGLYRVSYITLHKALGTVYMSEANANKLCKLLNEGLVEL